jgi:hypothetical protein
MLMKESLKHAVLRRILTAAKQVVYILFPTMLILVISFGSAKIPAFAACSYPVPDRIVARIERQEAQEVPRNVRSDVSLVVQKTSETPMNKGFSPRRRSWSFSGK